MALATLTNVLNYIKVQKINMKKLQAELTEEQLRGKVSLQTPELGLEPPAGPDPTHGPLSQLTLPFLLYGHSLT